MQNPLVLVVVAAIMVLVIALLIRGFVGANNVLQAKLIVFGVAMMVSMFVAAAVYIASPSGLVLAYAVGANMLVMVVGLVYILSGLDAAEVRGFNRRAYTKYFTALILVNEASMGFVFVEAQGQAAWLTTAPLRVIPANVVASSVNTYWFFVPLFFEMLSAAYYSKIFTRNGMEVYYAVMASTLLSPTLFKTVYWELVGLIVLLALSGYLSSKCFRRGGCSDGVYYLLALAASAAISYASHYWLLYAVASVIVIGWFFVTVMRKAPMR
jgi:hypothetical protein